jgi:hypothetical protein
MKTYGGVESVAPFTFISELDGGEWTPPCPDLLTSEEGAPCPLNRRLDGPQSLSGHLGNDKKLLSPSGIELRPVRCQLGYRPIFSEANRD